MALSALAFMTIGIPAQNTSLTAFGEDEDTSELSFWVDLEDNFTLGEASEEMQRYERFVEPYKETFGFRNVVARFDSDSGEIDLRWPDRIDPKRLDRYRAQLRRELPSFAGHRVYFRGQEEISDSSKQFVSFEIRGTDPDALQEIGEQAAVVLAQVDGLTDVTTSTEEAPDQLLLELDGDMAFAYGLNSQSTLRNVSWALRGAQLARFQEQGREVPMLIEYDSTAYAGVDTLKDLSIWGENGAVNLSTFSNIRSRRLPRASSAATARSRRRSPRASPTPPHRASWSRQATTRWRASTCRGATRSAARTASRRAVPRRCATSRTPRCSRSCWSSS